MTSGRSRVLVAGGFSLDRPVFTAAGVLIGLAVLWTIGRARRLTVETAAPAGSGAGYLSGLRVLLRNTNLMILALVSGIRSFTQHGLQAFLPLYLVNDLKIPTVLVGFYLVNVGVVLLSVSIGGDASTGRDLLEHSAVVVGADDVQRDPTVFPDQPAAGGRPMGGGPGLAV